MLENLENNVLGILRAHTNVRQQAHAILYVEWDTIAFLRDQYQGAKLQQIREVITLTGSGADAQAATCAQYVNQTWPTTGESLLREFQAAIMSILPLQGIITLMNVMSLSNNLDFYSSADPQQVH